MLNIPNSCPSLRRTPSGSSYSVGQLIPCGDPGGGLSIRFGSIGFQARGGQYPRLPSSATPSERRSVHLSHQVGTKQLTQRKVSTSHALRSSFVGRLFLSVP